MSRGSVVAVGYAIDAALIGADEACRRVLAVWAPGCDVRADGDRFVVSRLPARRVRTHQAPGEPLVTSPRPSGELVDVSAWVDTSSLAIHDAAPLADPPRVVVVAPAAPVSLRGEARVGEVSPEAAAFARALAGEPDEPPPPPGWFARVRAWWEQRRRPELPEATGSGTVTAVQLEPAEPGLFARLRERIARALWNSRLGEELGRRHADYLQRTLDLFDKGELDEALRHAVPVGGDSVGPSRLGIQAPRPRDRVELSMTPRRSGATMPAQESAIDMLRERYRAAAARLEREGRLEEAAFVLADLLGDVTAAIAMLERQKRYDLAARLADGHRLDSGLVVRLYFLADNIPRAIAVARQRDAWQDALARLEKEKHPIAPQVRLLYADALADAGDYDGAVRTAIPANPSRALLLAWIDRGIAADGWGIGTLLVRKLTLAPETFAEVAPRVLAIAADTDADAVFQRSELADVIAGFEPTPELIAISRPLARALIADAPTTTVRAPDGGPNRHAEKFVRYTNDAALRADLPPLRDPAERPTLRFGTVGVGRRWDSADVGSVPVFDAVWLPGDRFLVALGELGTRLVSRDGRTLAYFDQPAHRLAIADSDTRAIAIAPRGPNIARLAHLDLATRRASYWCDADCDPSSIAERYDGTLLECVRNRRELLAVDVSAPRFTATWGIDTDSPIVAVHRENAWLAIELADEVWLYEHRTLRERPGIQRPLAPSHYSIARRRLVTTAITGARSIQTYRDVQVVVHADADGVAVTVTHIGSDQPRDLTTLSLDGATRARARWSRGMLVVSDDRGRVLAFDPESGAVRRDLRIHV